MIEIEIELSIEKFLNEMNEENKMNYKLTRYIGSLSRRTLSFLARRDLDEEGGGADLGRVRGWEKAFERRVLMGSLGVLKS